MPAVFYEIKIKMGPSTIHSIIHIEKEDFNKLIGIKLEGWMPLPLLWTHILWWCKTCFWDAKPISPLSQYFVALFCFIFTACLWCCRLTNSSLMHTGKIWIINNCCCAVVLETLNNIDTGPNFSQPSSCIALVYQSFCFRTIEDRL